MKTSCGKFLNLAHYFPYDVKLRLLAHSWSFLANQKARNAIVGAENYTLSARGSSLRSSCTTSPVPPPPKKNYTVEFYFRSENRNKRARVLAARQAPSLKKLVAGRSCKQKRLRTLYAFPIFPESSNILMSLMETWGIIFVGNHFFRAELT